MEIFARFDPLAWSVLVGGILMFAGIVWLLIDDRPIQRRLLSLDPEESGEPPKHPARTRRAA